MALRIKELPPSGWWYLDRNGFAKPRPGKKIAGTPPRHHELEPKWESPMITVSKFSLGATLLFAVCNAIPCVALAEAATQKTSNVDISTDWISRVTWHQSHAYADPWTPAMGAGTWTAFSEFHSPKYDPEQIPLALTIANAEFAGIPLFAQPLRKSTEILPGELVEAVSTDLPNVQMSENFGRPVQPLQLFELAAGWASKLRNQRGRLQFDLRGMVGTFTRKAKISLNGPLKTDLPDQSIEVQIAEGSTPNAALRVADWQKYHVVRIKTIVPIPSGDLLLKAIRCYFLIDPKSNKGGLLGIMRYDSSSLATPAGLGPGLTGDERSFDVPEQISLKNEELYIYEFVPNHPFDVTLATPDFVMDIPPDSSK